MLIRGVAIWLYSNLLLHLVSKFVTMAQLVVRLPGRYEVVGSNTCWCVRFSADNIPVLSGRLVYIKRCLKYTKASIKTFGDEENHWRKPKNIEINNAWWSIENRTTVWLKLKWGNIKAETSRERYKSALHMRLKNCSKRTSKRQAFSSTEPGKQRMGWTGTLKARPRRDF